MSAEEIEDLCRRSDLPIYRIEEMRKKVIDNGGKDIHTNNGDRIIGIIKYIDGTVLDKVRIVRS